MKISSIIFFSLILIFTSCKNRNEENKLSGDIVNNTLTATGKTSDNHPVITFEKTTHDFGRILEGEKITTVFRFKNTGGSDLIISNVNASCGCTVPYFSKTPIKPGNQGEISVEFDSNRRSGAQAKSVSVLTNAQPSTVVLTVRAMIIEP